MRCEHENQLVLRVRDLSVPEKIAQKGKLAQEREPVDIDTFLVLDETTDDERLAVLDPDG